MLVMVMGLTTLVGFDAAANLAEEAKDPYRSVRALSWERS
jgi:amino acid transporter